MSDDNETVEQVLERMTSGMGRDCSVECQLLESDVVEYADRILTAHKREFAAKDAEIVRLNQELLDNQTQAGSILIVRDELIKELADALNLAASHTCYTSPVNVSNFRALVAKAREVLK